MCLLMAGVSSTLAGLGPVADEVGALQQIRAGEGGEVGVLQPGTPL